ncbi:MAG: ABC transporter permease [Cyclobacteriaceae bacterium]|nr:ABC transporter permease [Cyclobacteriaceae bacterium]
MLKNYILIAWRNFARQKGYSLLNISGLSVGLACCIVILLYVSRELSYDSFHEKGDRVFRAYQHLENDNDWAWTGGVTPSILRSEFKEIELAVSLHRMATYISYERPDGEVITSPENHFVFADSGFFEMFNFPLVKGSIGNTLKEPYGILITESIAEKYFGEADPVGKELRTTGNFAFVVNGVLKDVPDNSHIKFDFITGMVSFKARNNYPLTAEFSSHWWPRVWTYVLLDKPESADIINAVLPEIMPKHREATEVKRFALQLQPMKDIHLHSQMGNEIQPNGSIGVVYIFLGIAVFTLVLACINFINLATARAIKKAQEIGVRKTIGAKRSQLILQFFTESVLMNVIAFVFALVLVELALPIFNTLFGQTISFGLYSNINIWIFIIAILIVSGFLSGFYPALYLSRFRPVQVLKGKAFRPGGGDIRKGLVVFQFALSIALIFCTSVIWLQVQHFRDAGLGFDKEHVLLLKSGQVVRSRYDVLLEKMKSLTVVNDATGMNSRPGMDSGWGPQVEFEGSDPETHRYVHQQSVDHNFFDMMGVPVLEGRGFSKDIKDEGTGTLMRNQFPAFENRNFIVNEEFVRFAGKTNETVIGMSLRLYTEEGGLLFSETKGAVIGVVKDFNTSDLREAVRPTVFSPVRSDFGNEVNFIALKLKAGKFSESLEMIASVWKETVPEIPMEYSFLDQDIDNQYIKEKSLGNIVGLFAIVAMLISCLGLFGLSAYTAETCTKEIGIRKVLGASAVKIVKLLSKDYLMLVMLANVIAMPLGWWLMSKWLTQFAHRVPLDFTIFITVGFTAILISFLTVSFQAFRAATANPVKSLRYE